MSALGQKQTSAHVRVMSALPPKADIGTWPVPPAVLPHRPPSRLWGAPGRVKIKAAPIAEGGDTVEQWGAATLIAPRKQDGPCDLDHVFQRHAHRRLFAPFAFGRSNSHLPVLQAVALERVMPE